MKCSLRYMLKRHFTEPYFPSYQAYMHVNKFAFSDIAMEKIIYVTLFLI